MTEQLTVSEQTARFATEIVWTEIPDAVRRAARRSFAGAVGRAVVGSQHSAVAIALDTAKDLAILGRCPVLARSEELPVAWSAMAMAIAARTEEATAPTADSGTSTIAAELPFGSSIAPAALAVARSEGSSGRDMLTAMVAGMELAHRAGRMLGQSHFDRGWDTEGTLGHIGAAAAAGRLLGLSAEQMKHALALATTQAQGHIAQRGSMTEALHSGKAAFDGVEAAYLAQGGFTGPAAPIEGRRGLAALMSNDADLSKLVDQLGFRWELDGVDQTGTDEEARAHVLPALESMIGARAEQLWQAAISADELSAAGDLFALARR